MLEFLSIIGVIMNYASTNKTERSWKRMGIREIEPDTNTDSIMDKVRALPIDGMSFQNVVDYYKMNLASWRRFYKQDDTVQVTEALTKDGSNCTRLQSLNIIFYIIERKKGKVEIKASLCDFSDLIGSAADDEILEEL